MEQKRLNGHKKVILGASVILRIEPEGETICYRLVDEKDADIPAGKLSVLAPLAQVLFGRAEDELVTLETPGGIRTYRILEIRIGE